VLYEARPASAAQTVGVRRYVGDRRRAMHLL